MLRLGVVLIRGQILNTMLRLRVVLMINTMLGEIFFPFLFFTYLKSVDLKHSIGTLEYIVYIKNFEDICILTFKVKIILKLKLGDLLSAWENCFNLFNIHVSGDKWQGHPNMRLRVVVLNTNTRQELWDFQTLTNKSHSTLKNFEISLDLRSREISKFFRVSWDLLN